MQNTSIPSNRFPATMASRAAILATIVRASNGNCAYKSKLDAIFMTIKNKFYSELPKAAKKLGFKGGYKIEGGTPIPTDIFGE